MKLEIEKFEFYINQKKLKENKRRTFHKEVQMNFKGNATLINENKKETDPNYQIELSDGYIFNRSGNYKIIYQDTEEQTHIFYFSIRKKVPIFVFLLLFLPVLLSTLFFHPNVIHPSIEKELPIQISNNQVEEDFLPVYQFHLYLNNGNITKQKTMNLMDTVASHEKIHRKIAPGVKGSFILSIDTLDSTQDLEYEIKVKDKTIKPKNLYFKSDHNIEYGTLQELASKELKGTLGKNSTKEFRIQWEWKYEISDRDNQMDTKDAEEIATYQFEILAVGTEI